MPTPPNRLYFRDCLDVMREDTSDESVDLIYLTVQNWKSGDRQPGTSKVVLQGLDALSQRKRVPRRRRGNSPD